MSLADLVRLLRDKLYAFVEFTSGSKVVLGEGIIVWNRIN